MRSTKKYKIPVLLVCAILRGSAWPINILTRLRHTPCYLLEVDISRNLKGRVPVENTLTQNRHSTDESHTLACVIIKNLFERIFDGGARRVRFRNTWVWNEPGGETTWNNSTATTLICQGKRRQRPLSPVKQKLMDKPERMDPPNRYLFY